MSLVINWDQVSALARNKHVPKLRDNIMLSNPLLARMIGRQESWDGGPVIVAPLTFAIEGGGGGWYGPSDPHDVRARNPITAANYFPAFANVPLTITGQEELMVSGEAAVLSLVDAKFKIAEDTARRLISQNLYNAGTNPLAIGGLGLALKADIETVAQTYGGITCGGAAYGSGGDPNDWWQPVADHTGYTAGDGGTFMHAGGGTTPVLKAFNTVGLRTGGKKPSVLVGNYGLFGDYHSSLIKTETRDRMLSDKATTDSGFRNLLWNGIPWIADANAPRVSGFETLYGIDESAMNLYAHPQRNFSFRDWMKPVDQDTRTAIIYWAGQLCFTERRSSFVIDNVSIPASLLA